MGGDVFFSNWIDDGFGVVSTGAPGVGVLYENQPVGVTDSKGMLLVPTLRSYEKNNIAIDPTDLPVDAEVEGTSQIVAPANHGGVLVNFKVHDDTNSALVIFATADGGFVPAGSPGKIEGGDDFVVGYDGEAFIKNLRGSNVATVETARRNLPRRLRLHAAAGTASAHRPVDVPAKRKPTQNDPLSDAFGLRK